MKVEAVRPAGGKVLDLWDNMMKPFEEGERGEDNQDIGDEGSVGDNQGKGIVVEKDEEEG